jgi:YVTN family beta-propeller protein
LAGLKGLGTAVVSNFFVDTVSVVVFTTGLLSLLLQAVNKSVVRNAATMAGNLHVVLSILVSLGYNITIFTNNILLNHLIRITTMQSSRLLNADISCKSVLAVNLKIIFNNLALAYLSVHFNIMKSIKYSFVIVLIMLTKAALAQSPVTLPNGWKLSPAGKSLPLGDLPLNIAIGASKKLMAVTNNGQSKQSLQLIDVRSEKILDNIIISKLWLGLIFSSDEKYLYASGGNDNWILKYAVTGGKLILNDSIKLGKKWPTKISPAGIALDDAKHTMYVVTKDNNSLYIVDLLNKQTLKQIQLPGEAYTCLLSPDKKSLYISCWGCDKLLTINTESRTIVNEIAVGDNPNELCLTKNGRYLFVANSNDNAVSVIDIKNKKVIETLTASLYPDAPPGSTTNGLALSPDEKKLYIANADNNCLAVFNVSKPGYSISEGFIPTGWYPTCVKAIGSKIYVTNGKGFTSKANPYGPNPALKKQKVNYQGDQPVKEVQYIAGLFTGTLSIINKPSEKEMAAYSRQVYANIPYTKEKELNAACPAGNPIPAKVGAPSPIKHVFYIVKENRTYDQVLGDMKEGNGDTSLVLFGEKVTPTSTSLQEILYCWTIFMWTEK